MIGDMMRLFIRNIYKHNHLHTQTMNSIFRNGKCDLWSHFESVCRYWPEGLRPKIAQQSYVNVIHKNLINNVKLGSTFITASKQKIEQKKIVYWNRSVKLFSFWRNQRHGRGRRTEIACLKYFCCRENVIYGKTFRDF